MKELKKGSGGFVLLLLLYLAGLGGLMFFGPEEDKAACLLVLDLSALWLLLLSGVIYYSGQVHWYTGLSYEKAAAFSWEARRRYARRHLERFGLLALGFGLYSALSWAWKLPLLLDTALFCGGLLAVVFSSRKVRLGE